METRRACVHARPEAGLVCLCCSGGVEGGDSGWRGEFAGPKNARLGGGGFGGLDDGPGRSGEGDRVQPAQLAVDLAPGLAGAAFGDPDQQQLLNGTGPDDGAMVVRHWPR